MEEVIELAVARAVELVIKEIIEEVKESPCCVWSRKNMRKKCDAIKERKLREYSIKRKKPVTLRQRRTTSI